MKEIVIDAFTESGAICDFFPVSPAAKYMPEWWKRMPKESELNLEYMKGVPNATIKTCDGLTELYKKSIVIPLWSELILATEESGAWHYQWSNPDGGYMEGNSPESGGVPVLKNIHIKIDSPWILKEKTGVYFSWQQPTWNMIDNELFDYNIPPGMLEFRYQNTSNLNMLFPKKQNRIHFKPGTPMAMLVPLSDRPVKIKCHTVDEVEYKKMKKYQRGKLTFRGHYRNFFKKNPNR